MKKIGLSRPGAFQMIAAGVLMLLAAIAPLFVAITRPSHEWIMVLNGLPALAVAIAIPCVLILYMLGFFAYCSSKGYSKWLGFWLLLGNFSGLVVLVMLPDLHRLMEEQAQAPEKGVELKLSPS